MAKLEEQARKLREKKEREAEERRVQASGIYAEDGDYTSDAVPMFSKSFNAFRDYEPEPDMATQKQVNMLVKMHGVSPEKATQMTKRQAGAVIDKYMKEAAEGAPVKGMWKNKYPGKCVVTGKRVEAGAGWTQKNNAGKYETYSNNAAQAIAAARRPKQQEPQYDYEDAPF